jgi:hypothetical protein
MPTSRTAVAFRRSRRGLDLSVDLDKRWSDAGESAELRVRIDGGDMMGVIEEVVLPRAGDETWSFDMPWRAEPRQRELVIGTRCHGTGAGSC